LVKVVFVKRCCKRHSKNTVYAAAKQANNIFLSFYCAGCSVHLGVLKEHIKKPVGVAIAVSVQFVIMPLLVFLVARGASMPSVPAIALVVTTSVPGGSLSNVLSYLIKGDMALRFVYLK